MRFFTAHLQRNSFTVPKRFLLAGTLILAGILCAMLAPVTSPHLVVSSNGVVLYEAPVGPLTCEVNFRHSVNKGMVREIYQLDPKQERIALLQGRFQNYGAGMLDTVEGTKDLNFRWEDDYFVLDFQEDWKESIRYIGGPTAGHVFVYGDDTLSLGSEYPRKPFDLSVSRRSLMKILLHKL